MDRKMHRAACRIEGRSAAPGVALGPLLRLVSTTSQAPVSRSPAAERQAFADALEASRLDLVALAGQMKDENAEAILSFQIALLEDENLAAPAFALIADGETADRAWIAAIDPEIATYDGSQDHYFRARASDLRDLRDRVLRRLAGEVDQSLPAGVIVAADDMPPSLFLATDWRDGGLVLRRGSPSSHVAILARSRGVPMIVGADVTEVESGADAVLDADAGALVVNPDAELRVEYTRRHAEQLEARRAAFSYSGPTQTASGERVKLMINAEWACGKPVTIRTLDAGGDKPIAGLTQSGELNPFLGVRGVRLSLRRLEVFRVQLRALARAATVGNLKVMIPMVTVPEELVHCRALLQEAVDELRASGREAALPALGMMVEVPAAALAIEDFDADFFSIGSNDLIQYVAAASRDEPQLADLARPSRAVFNLIGHVVEHADRLGREASLCGDLAGDPEQAAALLDQGLRTFSVAPGALAPVRAAIARYSGKGA